MKAIVPEIIKVIVSAALLICLSSIFMGGALGQTPAKTLTPDEQEMIKAQKANEEAQAEYYREQTNKLRQPPLPATPTPGKTFRQSVAENPASVVGVVGTIIGAIIVALVSLTTLYFNSRNAIKAQRDSQFYEAMKRMGDKDSPTLRASAASLLALMAQQEWGEPALRKKWPFFKVEKSRPYFETAVNQLMVGHLLENNPVGTESIKKALRQLVPLAPQNIGTLIQELYTANLSLQDEIASLVGEFFVISNCNDPDKPFDDEQEEALWTQLKSTTGFKIHLLRKLVRNSPSYRNRFCTYGLIIDAQNTGDRGQVLSALDDKLQVASGHLRANITLFCTALGIPQLQDTPWTSALELFSFKRAFLVGGKIAPDANLSNIDFTYAVFSDMTLHNVTLAETSLFGATLEVLMEGGSLRNSSLSRAEFGGAWIRGVDMTDARLANAKIPAGLSSAWWKANFTGDDKIDTELLESLFERDRQFVPTDLNEVHASVRSFLESKHAKSEQAQSL
jgi:hypothetical protein